MKSQKFLATLGKKMAVFTKNTIFLKTRFEVARDNCKS